MVQEGLERKLVVVGEKSADKFTGTEDQVNGYQVKVCPLTTDNRKALQAIFDWLVPGRLELKLLQSDWETD